MGEITQIVGVIAAGLTGSGIVAAWMGRRKTAAEVEAIAATTGMTKAEAARKWSDLAQTWMSRAEDLEERCERLEAKGDEDARRWALAEPILRQCAEHSEELRPKVDALLESIRKERAVQNGGSAT